MSSYRNRKMQRLLLNIRLKCLDKPPLKEIEIPNPPRFLTEGEVRASYGAKLPPLVNLPSDRPSFNIFERIVIGLVFLVILIMFTGKIII